MNVLITIISYSLAWALVYSLLQGLFIYTVLFMVLKAFPALSARAKYMMSYSALAGMFVWFVYTWVNHCVVMSGVVSEAQMPDTGQLGRVVSLQYWQTSVGMGGSGLQQVLMGVEQLFPYFLIAYVIGLAFMTTRFVINIAEAGKLRKDGTTLQADFESIAVYWQERLGIRQSVRIFLTDRVNVPVMLGVIKPIILLPFATASYLTTEQVEAIILHELAHVKRRDYLFNMLQTVVETILFFNPFVWATSAIIRREREHCCDDIVVSCSGNPLPYAKALTILETQRMQAAELSMAATGHKNQLLNRIKRIMEMKNNNTTYSRPAIIVFAFIAVAFIAATLTPSFAQITNKGSNDTTRSKPVYKKETVIVDGTGKRKAITKVSDKPLNDKGDENNNSIDVNVSFTDHDNGEVNQKVYKKKIVIDKGDFSEMSRDLAKASDDIKVAIAEMKDELGAVDWAKIKKDLSEAVAELDKTLNDPALHKKIKVEVSKDLDNAKLELDKAGRELRKSRKVMADARAGRKDQVPNIPEIHSNSDEIETMLVKMEGDGLINRSTIFRIEKSGNELYVNGKRQSRAVYEKYKSYLPYRSAEIKGDKETLNVNIDN